MKLQTKIEALGYANWYMDLLTVHIVLFGMYSSNSLLLINKIILLCYYNNIDRTELESVYNKSNLRYFERDGFCFKKMIGLNNLELENMN